MRGCSKLGGVGQRGWPTRQRTWSRSRRLHAAGVDGAHLIERLRGLVCVRSCTTHSQRGQLARQQRQQQLPPFFYREEGVLRLAHVLPQGFHRVGHRQPGRLLLQCAAGAPLAQRQSGKDGNASPGAAPAARGNIWHASHAAPA